MKRIAPQPFGACKASTSLKRPLVGWVLYARLAALLLSAITPALAQLPSPELPRVYIDTHWSPPIGGKSFHPHTADEFQRALNDSNPGDTIVLDPGATYAGSFTAPAKPNPERKWIYIQGSEIPAVNERLDPARDAARMPKIVATGNPPAISILPGASFYRFTGLEFYSTSRDGCDLDHKPRVNCFTYFLLDMPAASGKPLPDSITVDRCYLHGSDTQDIRAAVVANGTNVAVIDSYIANIHQSTNDSQAIRSYRTPGPIKVVNNFLSSTTENLMFGGAGGADNPYISSDLEIRNNHFYKPERWAAAGITIPPAAQWSVKNLLEFKSARRVLVTGNIFENNWAGAQKGFAIVLTVRTHDSGNLSVVDDITFENNLLRNVASGFNSGARDDLCNFTRAPLCNNPGEARRWKISNNLIQLRSADAAGGRPLAFQFGPDLADVAILHNTVVPAARTTCWGSVYFPVTGGTKWPLANSSTRNIWIMDNVLCRPPTGDYGGQGIAGLELYMGDPPPVDKRFAGNVIFVPKDAQPPSFPASNRLVSSGIRFANPLESDYELILPKWTKTTDGKSAGVDMKALNSAIAGATSPNR